MKLIIGLLVGFAAGFYYGNPDGAVAAGKSLVDLTGVADYFDHQSAP